MHRPKPSYPGYEPPLPREGDRGNPAMFTRPEPQPPANSIPFYNPNNFAPPQLSNGGWAGPAAPTRPKEQVHWTPQQSNSAPVDPWDWGEDPASSVGPHYSQPPAPAPPAYPQSHQQHYAPQPPNHYDYPGSQQPPSDNMYYQAPPPVSNYQQDVSASHDPWSWGEDIPNDKAAECNQQPSAVATFPVYEAAASVFDSIPSPQPVRDETLREPQSNKSPAADENSVVSGFNALSLQDIPLVPVTQYEPPQHVSGEQLLQPSVQETLRDPVSSWGPAAWNSEDQVVDTFGSLGERSTAADGAAFADIALGSSPQDQQPQAIAHSDEPSTAIAHVPLQQAILEPVELLPPQPGIPKPEPVEVNPVREATLDGSDASAAAVRPTVAPPKNSEQKQSWYPVDPVAQNPVRQPSAEPAIPAATERSGFYIGSPTPVVQTPPTPVAAVSPRPQPAAALLERDSERPDGEGGDDNEQPAPLNPVFVQPVAVASRPASRQAAPPLPDVYSQHFSPVAELPPTSAPPTTAAPRSHPPQGGYHQQMNPPAPQNLGQLSPHPRNAQEAVGSEFGPPSVNAPPSRPHLPEAGNGSLPPSSRRMIPGSQAVVSPQAVPPPVTHPSRPTPASTPAGDQRIVTGYAKNDHPQVAAPPVPLSTQQGSATEDARSGARYPAPPPHRSETIGSENPSFAGNVGSQVGSSSVERLDDRPSSDRDREADTPLHRNRPMERERDRERDRDRDYDRSRRSNRYHDDDEDERYSMGYRDRRYDDRDYDDDRSAYSERVRDRRRDSRRSEYPGDTEYMERSGRRSSLYDPEVDEYNRAYSSSRDPRRRDYPERSRHDDRYYSQRERSRHGSTSGDPADRTLSERDYRGRDPRYDYRPDARDPRDPRDPYYRGGYDYYGRNPYDPYRGYQFDYSYYYKYNYAAFYEEMKKNPAAYQEWYQRHYGQHRYPAAVPATATATASEADRASVHSGRSSVNDEVLKERQAAQSRSSAAVGLEQSSVYDYMSTSVFQEEPTQEETTVAAPLQDLTPLKFSSPHVITRFSAGMLLRVLPNDPKEGVPAYIELHDIDTLLQDLPSAQELRNFPGPLVPGQTHKQNVIAFCQQKIRKVQENTQLFDRQSYLLLWELLLLLLRQNGTVLGSDISELLLKDIDLQQDLPGHNDTSDPATDVSVDRALVSMHSEASVISKFRELLLFGNKKEALEWAMRQGLWGHALFLASKMDQRIYSNVMTRFANGLSLTDPLQTLYQLMSGRQPSAVTNCGDEKWGDWRPHLAMIMSNTTEKPELDKKSIVAMGDHLASKGYLLAAQFCYLVAQVDFGTYSNKTSKLVLLTSSPALPFDQFAAIEAIQCTEVYEYARRLATPDFVIPTLQSYKFLYATRLAEQGRPAEALQYCEATARTLLKQPALYHSALIQQVHELSSMLKYHDAQYQTSEGSLEDPDWLKNLAELANQKPLDAPAITEEPLWIQQQQQQQQAAEQQQFYNQEQTQQFYNPEQLNQQHYYEQQPTIAAAETAENPAPTADYSQDYNNYWSQYNDQYNQYNQQQQQQQQWNYDATTNGITDYAAPEGYNNYNQTPAGFQKCKARLVRFDTTGSKSGDSTPTPEAENEDPDLLGNDEEEVYLHKKRVVVRGTFPIDQPLTQGGLRFISRPTQLTIQRPKTFSIDEPVGRLKEESYGQSQESYTQQQEPQLADKAAVSTKKTDEKIAAKDSKSKQQASAAAAAAGGGWFGGLFNKFSLKPKNQMKLPDDKNPPIVWDPEKKRWVNTQGDEDEAAGPAAPPKDSELHSKPPVATPLAAPPQGVPAVPAAATPSPVPSPMGAAAPTGPPPAGNNKYKLPKGRGIRQSYVDVFAGSKSSNTSSPPMPELYPAVGATPTVPTQFFVPPPVAPGNETADFASAGTGQGPAPAEGAPKEAAEPTPLMFNPSQFAAPAAPAGRGGGIGGRRYPR